jgi:hypothetical protein
MQDAVVPIFTSLREKAADLPPLYYFPYFSAAVSVFLRSIVIVIGPTPPGTGVM